MIEERPDPDLLLARVQAEEARQARGKLKVFFGAAPGVGKTYAMLEAARKVAKEGFDVVIGYIEPHARPDTQALVLGLDVLGRHEVSYRGATLYEFDLEAALIRKPQLLIVDELAHTNAPGMTHEKRWQDVEELLVAGIDIYTTLNVQHLESLNDVVAQITHVQVRETLPDSVFERADEIELVDIAPDDLIERLREGKVYVPEQARRAIDHFFKKGHLIALRELALRRTAERVDAQMIDYRQEHAIERTWPATDRLLVCVGPSPMSGRLVRATRRMAASLRVPWTALHVETPGDARMSDADRQRLADNLHLAEQLGGATATVSGQSLADDVLSFARSRNVTKIIVGKPQKSRWRDLLYGSYVYELTRKCGDIDVYVISGERDAPAPAGPRQVAEKKGRVPYLGALGTVAGATTLAFAMYDYFSLVNLVMIYLLAVVAVSLSFGRGPSILASLVSVAAFDFCFVAPRYSFAVGDTQYLLTFLVMLVTGLLTSELTSRVRFAAEGAREREQRTAALYGLARELAMRDSRTAIAESAARQAASAVAAEVFILLPDETQKLQIQAAQPASLQLTERVQGVAEWVLKNGEAAGLGTRTLPGALALYLPMQAGRGAVGIFGAKPLAGSKPFDSFQVHLLETFASMTALAIERAELAEVAERNRLQIEAERLRNSLLSAVSHDLRTPLAAIAGASSTLVDADAQLDGATRRELAESIYEETERLNRLVANLLDMTRLEGGAISVRKEWQPIEEIVGVVLNRLARQLQIFVVETRLDPALPLVPIDDLLIQQVLMNLLENAIHFSLPGGQIELSAKADEKEVILQVADRGPGLKPGDEERVFDKFYRSGNGSPSGAGLGLAICRGIVELHDGRIWAENRPGGGAVFAFSIPLIGEPPELEVAEDAA
jgi:two-component system, OmpR family, sensor histidine kinase KdpD